MQNDKRTVTKVMTPEFRVSFPNVFTARSGFDGQPAKFSVVMLFPKSADLSAMKRIAQEVAMKKWPKGLPKNFRNPFRDGDKEKDGMEGYANVIFITASSKNRPGLVDANRVEILSATEFYAGCYARATVNAFAYEKAGNAGVSFGLQNIQKLRDGEPFSGRTKAEDDFDAISSPDDIGAAPKTGTKPMGMFD